MEASSRRLGLEVRDLIRGAGLEAEPTVDTALEARRVEDRAHVGIRPGARTPRGSKRSLSARAMPSGKRAAPHAPPTARLESALARSSTATPPAASTDARTVRK